ncbi:MAG: NAD(P)-dependent oxidoreductase [Tannerella sp.]|nr:NAD(P)-dependent oxidoreductase [Tannerella sp.]
MKKRVLITGANGFIGSALVEEALRHDYEVWAGVRASSSLERLPKEKIRTIDLKYNDPEALPVQIATHVQQYGAWDYVIHNAGLTKTNRPSDFFLVNAEYTRRLLTALSQPGCQPRKFLLMSSLSTYAGGDRKTLAPIRLDDPQKPETFYGKSKLMAENHVRQQDFLSYVILRPTGVYGPGDKDYLMEIESIRSGFDLTVGMTPQHITFIYVKDLAEVAFQVLENANIRNREYFVADGDVYTDTQFARLIQDVVQKKRVFRARIPMWLAYLVCLCSEWLGRLTGKAKTLNTDKYKILKQRNWICDSEPLRNELGFRPKYNLRKGLEETIGK